MKRIAKPVIKAKDVFLECISTVANAQLKTDYTNCQNLIENAEQDFDNKFPLHHIYQIPRNPIILGSIGKKEMKKVYTYRMVHGNMPGYKFYNKLKSSAPNGKCPLCSVRLVDTIDHYLPKSEYPIFSVTPINLVPACTPCNKGKLISYPTNSEEQTFHPYYDDVEDDSWIKAQVLPTNPVSFNYYVDCPAAWPQIQKDRAENHFKAYHLNELFSSHANEEFQGAKLQLETLYKLHPDQMIKHLKVAHSSRLALGVNSWQAIMYLALLNDHWFIHGGPF